MADLKFDPLVNYVNRVPVAADFSFRNGMWPICVNALNGDLYIIETGTAPYNTIKRQSNGAKLDAIQALANAAGYLHNDGSGAFAYSTPTATVAPGLMAFLAAHG